MGLMYILTVWNLELWAKQQILQGLCQNTCNLLQ